MQSLDSPRAVGAETALDEQRVATDRARDVPGIAAASLDAAIVEAAARRRAKRLALSLMVLSASFVVALAILIWVVVLA